jgi:hypothetical protein
MQFINISIVVLLVNFNFDGGFKVGALAILQGKYTGFTADWYASIGKTLCTTLVINIFSPHASKLAIPMIKVLLRCWDRRCRCWLKKGENEVHT